MGRGEEPPRKWKMLRGGGARHAPRGGGDGRRQVADAPMIWWGCRLCKLRDGHYRTSFTRRHERDHQVREKREREACDHEALRRQEDADARANHLKWTDCVSRRTKKHWACNWPQGTLSFVARLWCDVIDYRLLIMELKPKLNVMFYGRFAPKLNELFCRRFVHSLLMCLSILNIF